MPNSTSRLLKSIRLFQIKFEFVPVGTTRNYLALFRQSFFGDCREVSWSLDDGKWVVRFESGRSVETPSHGQDGNMDGVGGVDVAGFVTNVEAVGRVGAQLAQKVAQSAGFIETDLAGDRLEISA
jgi:hypothetical protein